MNKYAVTTFLTVLAVGTLIFVWNYMQLVNDMKDLEKPGFGMEHVTK